MQEYEAKIAALKRLVGRQALEIELLKGALKHAPGRKTRAPPSSPAPWRLRQQGVRPDGAHAIHLLRHPASPLPDDGLLARIGMICDEFECYGYRRVGAALRHQGVVVNGKKLRRLMREHDLQPKQRRRYVVTTDSDHAGRICADLAKGVVLDRPNQIWVADLTYVAIPGGFIYLGAIVDAWSRKVVGYAISRSMDARIAVAALKAAIRNRAPPKGCIHHPIVGRNTRRRCIARDWPPMA